MTPAWVRKVVGLVAVAILAAACTNGEASSPSTAMAPPTSVAATTTSVTAVAEPPEVEPEFFLVLMWNQHQPRYPLGDDGSVTRPWVRLHAIKDYYDMAATLASYPDVSAVFNLTPTLLLQLEELAGGVKDIYWAVAEIPATDLTEEDKLFLLERFFDANRRVISGFPRFQELLDRRDEAGGPRNALRVFGEADYRDLQILFNLAWTDPDLLAIQPLESLVTRGRDFTEEDKATLFAEHVRIIEEVIPLHSEMWESGQIEVTTSPLAHPILPLIADASIGEAGEPSELSSADPFQEAADADQQVARGLAVAERLLGRRPAGMWPAEGSVAEQIMPLFTRNEVEWIATGEQVLASSLALESFTRDTKDLVAEADLLYRPWRGPAGGDDSVPMFFRDTHLSDLIGFEYAGMSGPGAAADFMARLRDIKEYLHQAGALEGDRPPVVTVVLDGENAWEHYPNDGKDFLNALYSNLSAVDFVRTITPSEYLAEYPAPDGLDAVYPGSWFGSNFATWIGEPEESAAWEYLQRVRGDLREAERSTNYRPEQVAAAYESMLLAEGSDWFWWYGADQESGDDPYFDGAFRDLLAEVYVALGEDVPGFLEVPIVPQPAVPPGATPADLFTPTVDFDAGSREWAPAGRYDGDGEIVDRVFYGFDRENLYLRVDFELELLGNDDVGLEVYLGGPSASDGRGRSLRGSLLGFPAHVMLEWRGATPIESCRHEELPAIGDEALARDCVRAPAGFDGNSVEFAVPLRSVGPVESGDRIHFRVLPNDIFRDTHMFPATGPARAQVPDMSDVDVFLSVADPRGDDHGPGTYTYPTERVFGAGTYDLTLFEAGTDDGDMVFTFELLGPIRNPWASPRELSLQTFDVYIDTDPGAGTGARTLLPGRNAALPEGNGWEYGITIEGWDPALYVSDREGASRETTPPFDVIVFGDKGRVVVRVPQELLGDGDPVGWGYTAAVMSHEGYPTSGVRRIRDIAPEAALWRAGGAPADINHTRIFDVAWATGGEQESLLSDYPAVTMGSVEDLRPDQFPVLPMLIAG